MSCADEVHRGDFGCAPQGPHDLAEVANFHWRNELLVSKVTAATKAETVTALLSAVLGPAVKEEPCVPCVACSLR